MGYLLKFILMSLVLTFVVNRLIRLWVWFSGDDKKNLRKTAQNLKNEYQEGYRKEGDLYVSKKPEQKSHISGGDYVDYEEVK